MAHVYFSWDCTGKNPHRTRLSDYVHQGHNKARKGERKRRSCKIQGELRSIHSTIRLTVARDDGFFATFDLAYFGFLDMRAHERSHRGRSMCLVTGRGHFFAFDFLPESRGVPRDYYVRPTVSLTSQNFRVCATPSYRPK
jgi:ribosomal protein S14